MGVRSDDLLVLLAVERHRTFSAAAHQLGVDHTTVARRVAALSAAVGGRLLVEAPGGWELTPLGERATASARMIEDAVAKLDEDRGTGSLRGVVRVVAPEVFTHQVVAPAVAMLCRHHPELACELIAVTRPTPMHGPTADLDIGVTRIRSRRVETHRLMDYELGLFASREYLETHAPIRSRSDLRGHTSIYYVESMLQVADLDHIDDFFPDRRGLLGATTVKAQLVLAREGAGIALLPTYLVEPGTALQRVLADEASVRLTYWMTARPINWRRPEVAAVAEAVRIRAGALARSGVIGSARPRPETAAP